MEAKLSVAEVKTEFTEVNTEQKNYPFRLLNGMVYFNGECDMCRSVCAAACCRGYSFVSLTEEEAKSGMYKYREASDTCNCDTCTRMRQMEIRYILRRLPDGSCMYLDGERKCSIYKNRPETCKNYSCVDIPFDIKPAI